MRIRVGEHIAECIIRDPAECLCTVRFFASGAEQPRWERRFEVSKDTSGGFVQPAIGVDRFRVRQGQIELAYYRYCRGPGGREPSRVVRLSVDGAVPDSPQTRPVRAQPSMSIDEVSEAPDWSVLPIHEVSVGAVLHALDQADRPAVAQMLNASSDPRIWTLAAERGAAPRDWKTVDLAEWAFVPAGRTTVPMWVAREPTSIHDWVELLPKLLGPVRASLPPLLKGLAPADASARPITHVGWHEAVVFCDTLSRKHGLELVGQAIGEKLGADGTLDSWDAAATRPASYAEYARSTTGYRLPVAAEWTVYRGLAGRCNDCHGHGLGVGEGGDVTLCGACAGAGSLIARGVAASGRPPSLSTIGESNEWGIFDGVGNVLEWTIHAPEELRRRGIGGTWAPAAPSLEMEDDPRMGLRPVRTAPM